MKQGKMKRKFLSAIRASLCILTMMILFVTAFAEADRQATLSETEWSWEPGGTASFSGTFTIEGPDQEDAVLTLELETSDPENQGTIVFTEINGKSVKIRKRSETLTADVNGNGSENTFQGDWYLPEDAVSMSRATIRFRAESKEGQVLAAAELMVGSEEESDTNPLGQMLNLSRQLKTVLLIVAGILWIAAIARNLILRKNHQ